jgi:hypothetical protein
MKVTINGKISTEALKSILETQKEKTVSIQEFCKKEKISSFSYKDAELEYEYEAEAKTKKVEVRAHDKGN